MADPWASAFPDYAQPPARQQQPPARAAPQQPLSPDYNPFLDFTQPAQPPLPLQQQQPRPAAQVPARAPPQAMRAAPQAPRPAPVAQVSANPFDDLDEDDLSDFFSPPSAAQKSSAVPAPAGYASEYKPPTVEQQRLCRSASVLFERGLLIKADKNLLQDLILSDDQAAVTALELAEREGNLKQIEIVLRNARGPATRDASSIGGGGGGGGGGGRGGGGGKGGDDSDDEQAELIGDSRRESWAVASNPSNVDHGAVEAPHPAAGGFTSALPQGMLVANGMFQGSIMLRVSSKKMFRKWKAVYFTLDKRSLSVYEDKRDFNSGAAPRMVVPMHCCMWVAKPTLKKTYSLIDDGRRVYFSTLKENSLEAIMAAESSGMDKPVTYSPALESHAVAKFGSHFPNEISAMAHGLYSVIVYHQKEAKKKTPKHATGSSRNLA